MLAFRVLRKNSLKAITPVGMGIKHSSINLENLKLGNLKTLKHKFSKLKTSKKSNFLNFQFPKILNLTNKSTQTHP